MNLENRLPTKLDTILNKYGQQIAIFITTSYDRFYTIWPDLDIDVKIPNNWPRFTTKELAVNHWNKIKHKFRIL